MTLRLELESGIVPGPVDGRSVARALALLGTEDGSPGFAILVKGPSEDHYMQTRVDEAGFIVEMREGLAGAHFMALRSTSPDPLPPERKWWHLWRTPDQYDRFTLEEVSEIFRSYVEGARPSFWRWVPLELTR